MHGTTRAPVSRTSRERVGMVAAWTPKNGTKIDSLRPKSMSGK